MGSNPYRGRARSGLRDWGGGDVCATPCVMGVGPRAQRLVSRGGACAQRLVSPGACAQRLVYVYNIIEFRLRFCHTLTVLINVSAFVELYNTVLNFRHFFLRFPVSFTAMSPFQAGSCDRMKSSEECAMINQILLSRLFAGRFPLSKEEQSWSLMMVGTQQSTVSLGSLDSFLRTCRRSRCFDCKVHKCETWKLFASLCLVACHTETLRCGPEKSCLWISLNFPHNHKSRCLCNKFSLIFQ